jgi:hypothetical protein
MTRPRDWRMLAVASPPCWWRASWQAFLPMLYGSPRLVAAGPGCRGAVVPLTGKPPGRSPFLRLSKVVSVSTSCPSSSPRLGGSPWKRAGHRQFAYRRPRAHRNRQTSVVGSCRRSSSREAGSRLLRGAVADCEGNRDRVADEATARTVRLACSPTRRAASSCPSRDGAPDPESGALRVRAPSAEVLPDTLSGDIDPKLRPHCDHATRDGQGPMPDSDHQYGR